MELQKVKVYCCVKPCTNGGDSCLSVIDECTVSLIGTKYIAKQSVHTFSEVFGPHVSQVDLFNRLMLPMIPHFIGGQNVLLFLYGVTGSGKTRTMQGTLSQPGILPRCVDVLFNSISSCLAPKYVVKPDGQNGFDVRSEADAIMDRQRLDYGQKLRRNDCITEKYANRHRQSGNVALPMKSFYAVFISFYEIYNNKVYDLLEEIPKAPGSFSRSRCLREDVFRNVYVQGCVEAEVQNAEEALKLFYQGQKRRHVGTTKLNKESSRSHSIFSIRLVRTGYDANYDEALQDKSLLTISQLCLVDLAGSERTNRSGTTGDRLREASTINNSLMNLRKCIETLRCNQNGNAPLTAASPGIGYSGGGRVVPYRDAKLTYLFKNFFEGGGHVLTLICVHQDCEDYDETVHVLNFAESSQQVTTYNSSLMTPRGTPHSRSTASSRSCSPVSEAASDQLLAILNQIGVQDKQLWNTIHQVSEVGAVTAKPDSCDGFAAEVTKVNDDFLGSPEPCQKNMHLIQVRSQLSSQFKRRKTTRGQLQDALLSLKKDFRSRILDLANSGSTVGASGANLGSIATLKIEKLQLDSKIRHLKGELAEQKSATLQERAQRLRDAEESRVLYRKLQKQLEKLATVNPLAFVPTNDDGVSQYSKDEDTGQPHLSKRSRRSGKKSSPQILPQGTSLVSVLSKQWEEHYAKKELHDASTLRSAGTSTTRLANTARPTASVLSFNKPAAFNPRHRRSKSVGGDRSVWLEHKERAAAPLGTVLTPTVKLRKSVTRVDLKDTQKATDYLLHHQTTDVNGNVETQFYKGSIIPTAGGGSAVILNDVEELRQTSPLNSGGTRKSTRTSIKHARPLDDSDVFEVAAPARKRRTTDELLDNQLCSSDCSSSLSSSIIRDSFEIYHCVTPPSIPINTTVNRRVGLPSFCGRAII